MFNLKVRQWRTVKRKRLVAYYYQDSKISEQYRQVITHIKFSSKEQECRLLLITSPGFKEGKSITAINLSTSMAQLEEKVLLVDADLRKPTLHDTFSLDNKLGLTTVLQGHCALNEAIHHTGLTTLDVLPSGPMPNNTARILGSKSMRALTHYLMEQYDRIIFDTPPFLEVTDANLLANQGVGIILVVKKGKTKHEHIHETKHLIDMSEVSLLGTVLNEI
ncbi:putative tyrosine-protein kinase YveL [Pullulanibacillus camelliae]|uniref:non-specific protein-tyrosine kinase n=1 Tax=Pullulanibacillus camelliae TaxID=1707096 RepID=A0A8J2VNA4_9BACL|nr:CpsD/CapB family tyrosine-protein kinase [Pullulanibacillus camelliae]GGE30434.1 putative tyrosine-protein kinase YveL [Pullulanibacillus camelliae]